MNAKQIFAKVTENWPVKVLSIGLAIILFVFHRMSTLEEHFFSVPLHVESKGGLMPSSPYPQVVRVYLRGDFNSIHSILEEDIETYIDVGKFDIPGAHIVPVQWRKKGTALGVEPLQITVDPVEITVVLDYKIHKVVPLAPKFHGQVDAGYTMTSYSFNPSQAIVDGPAELVWSILYVYTDAIDLDGVKSDFTMTVNVLAPDPFVTVRGKRTAEFHGIVNQIVLVRNITNIPIAVTGLGKGLAGDLEIKTCVIHLEGENQNVMHRFEPPPGFLRVDCSGITGPGTYTLSVQSGNAENLMLRVEPNEVRIRVSSAAGDGKP